MLRSLAELPLLFKFICIPIVCMECLLYTATLPIQREVCLITFHINTGERLWVQIAFRYQSTLHREALQYSLSIWIQCWAIF